MPDSSYSSFPSLPSYEPSGSAGTTPAERVMMEVSKRHADFLNMASSAHAAYLNTVAQVMVGSAAPQAEPVRALTKPETASIATPAYEPQARPTEAAETAASSAPHRVSNAPVTRPSEAQPATVAPTPAPAVRISAPSAKQKPDSTARAGGLDAIELVRGIIADKTGYPEDMLDADMDLEGELGVDSIKQVEILSTLREKLPNLPEIDPEKLVELRTIAAIADMVSATDAAPAMTNKPAQSPSSAPESTPAVTTGKITADIVRELIAEKTGYPSDMLEDDMDLEGELGVDSIKQVEILSALREQHPDLPEVDPEALVELRTIRAIANFFA